MFIRVFYKSDIVGTEDSSKWQKRQGDKKKIANK